MLGSVLFCRDLRSAGPADGLNLTQFRAQAAGQNARSGEGAGAPRTDEAFFRLLRAQAREAAARQSLDRLGGWQEATRKRVQAQHVPALDAEMLRFAVARISAELGRYEQERTQALRQANQVLGRPADSPLTPLLHDSEDAAPAVTTTSLSEDSSTPAVPSAAKPGGPSPQPEDVAPPSGSAPKELLSLGTELLAKTYQGYLFGGVPVSALLWQEREVFETDFQHRLAVLEAERRRFASADGM